MLAKLGRKIMGSYVPIINIDGPINTVMVQKIQHKLQKLKLFNSEALAISINTTGGLPVQCQILAKKIKSYSRKNNLKLLTFGRQIVSSGGYLLLANGDEVYCDVSSVVGNIGVTIPKYDLRGGLEYFSLQQKKLKSNQNIFGQKLGVFHQLTQKEKQTIKSICDSMHNKLIHKVKQARGNKLKKDQTIFDGTLFTGRQAKQLGLVDDTGSMLQILQRKYPHCKLGIQRKTSIWNSFLKTF